MATQRVKTTKIDLRALVSRVDPNYKKPETVYKFSNGREFKTTDRGTTGFYRT